MKIALSKRIVSFVLCLTVLLAGFSYKPQKAEAFAISASVVASVIMIMTACGVTFWAASQGDAESYISQKLGEYFDTLQSAPSSALEWLGIDSVAQLFTVLAGGFVSFRSSVVSPILDFVSWFNQTEGVVSDGDPVGDATSVAVEVLLNSRLEGSASTSWVDSDTLRLTFDGLMVSNSGFNGIPVYFFIPLTNLSSQTVLTVDSFTVSTTAISDSRLYSKYSDTASTGLGNWFSLSVNSSLNLGTPTSSNNYISLGFLMLKNGSSLSGDIIVSISGQDSFVSDDTVLVSPSSDVSVPDELTEDAFVITPSVSLSEGMSVDDASTEIFSGVTSSDGLTSSVDSSESPSVDLSGVLDVLGSILDAILAIPAHIAELPSAIFDAFNSVLSSIKSVIESIKSSIDYYLDRLEYYIISTGEELYNAIHNVLDGVKSDVASIAQTVIGIPQAIGQAASDVITGIGNAISTALYNAFVPSEAAIDAFVVTLAENFDNHFSILSYPFSLLGKFILEVVDAPGDHTLSWPDIFEPFSGQRLIAAGSYNLDTALENQNFRTAYDTYMTVIKGYIAFQFVAYLYAWFCDVFRMRNDDFDNPIFTQDPIDEGDDEPDDWDGYDSFFET